METEKSAPSSPDSLRAAAVRAHLDSILADFASSRATRLGRLLRYLVEQALEDRAEALKESVIATEVFDRAPGYDPQIDSVVRVEVRRLRSRLSQYYEKNGADAAVRIEIPRGSYLPVFVFRGSTPEPTLERRPNNPPPDNRSRGWIKIAAGVVAIAAMLGAFAVWRMRSASVAPAAIAVLPFLNLSKDPADEYLADGISEELTETLAEFNDLRVVARTSAFQYKGKSIDVGEIGRSLRAEAVLEGSVARRGDKLRVIAQLIRTSDGYHLWSHSYDVSLAELSPAEAGIAQAAREKLTLSSARPASTEAAAARNPEAHDLYMRAVYEFNQRTEASTRQAMDLARQATEKDPSFAQPFVVMAAGESQLTELQAQSSRAGAERAWQYVAKALALDPANSSAHAQKALLAYTDHWDWPQAEGEFKLALAAGSHGSAENLYGWCLITRGRFEEARRRLQLAAELDPLSLGPQLNQVQELMVEQKYPEANLKVNQILHTAPTNGVALSLAASLAFWQTDCPATKQASGKLVELYPKAPAARLSGFAADYICGHPHEARAAALEMFQHSPGQMSPYSIAGGTIVLGGTADNVMPYLEKSAELREPRLLMLRYDRAFDSIRHDARLIALERRLGLIE